MFHKRHWFVCFCLFYSFSATVEMMVYKNANNKRRAAIFDLGTEILLLTKNDHNLTQKAPKSMIPVRVCTVFCVDSESAVKTRF